MKKKLIGVLALLACVVMLFTACGSLKQKPIQGGPSADAAVSSNGGLVVKKGDYYYYINGKAAATDKNKFKDVVKGSIVRCKDTDLLDASKHNVIVPKIALSSNSNGGFFIFGNYIYFTTPNDKKDKQGNVQSQFLDFMRTTLDGSKTTFITSASSHTVDYKYLEKDGKVFIALVDENKVSLIDCDKPNKKTEVFGEKFSGAPLLTNSGILYYTKSVYWNYNTKEELDTNVDDKDKPLDNVVDAGYNKVFKVDLLGDKASKEVFQSESSENKKRKITLKKVDNENGYVYYTSEGVKPASSNEANDGYKALEKRNLEFANKTIVTTDTSITNYVTAPDKNGIIYQNEYGIFWSPEGISEDKEIYEEKTTITNTKIQTEGEGTNKKTYLYYYVGAIAKKLEIPNTLADWTSYHKVPEILMEDKDSKFTAGTDWLFPEIIDGKMFFFNSAENSFDIKVENKVSMYVRSGYITVYNMSDKAFNRVGILTKGDKELEDKKVKEENKRLEKEKA